MKEFEPEARIAWGDGKGIRSFTIAYEGRDALRFSMTERIGGLLFPLYAKYIPPFDELFERFAKDLKMEAEIQHAQNAKNTKAE